MTCVLHIASDISGEIKQFNDNTWAKVKSAASDRRKFLQESKYFSIKLEDTYKETDGYHMQCYRNFTAVPQVFSKSDADDSSKQHHLRSDSNCPSTSSSGIFPRACLFCNKVWKSLGRNRQTEKLGNCESFAATDAIIKAAQTMNDFPMLSKISGIDLIAKEVKYHHSCRRMYLQRAQRTTEIKDCNPKVQAHSSAFEHLQLHIQHTFIDNDGAELLTSLHKRYLENLKIDDSQYTAQSLVKKIMNSFPTLQQTKAQNRIVIYSSQLTPESAIRLACYDKHYLKETARYLRTLVLNVKKTQSCLPDPLTVEALAEGQGDTPEELFDFFRTLFAGSETTTERIDRQAQSICDDVMFITSRGRTKPSKQLCLGLGLKSLTGSRQVIDILNKFGHSVCYHTVESIETELACVITEKHHASPDGIHQQSGLCTGIAWDNYDENSETLSGSGTLHDTVGICYQNMKQTTEDNQDYDTDNIIKPRKAKPKRSFSSKDTTLEPYRKKPKIKNFEYEKKEVPRPLTLTNFEYRDILWMISLTLKQTPMWTGWNSLITEDPLPKQNVLYMENISLPPTRLDVVVETMKISQQVASECDEEYIVVHYDLAIAKPALQIQATESPRFDNLFIAFGPFHICLAYFGALGHFIENSGGPEILTESDVLASGSLNGFLSGKHYNRYVF